jgi:hypothetical protein
VIPDDANTNETAYVSRGNDAVPVTTEGTWLAVALIPLTGTVGGSVIPGQAWVKLMMLNLDNRGISGANAIAVHALSFNIENRFGDEIDPWSALQGIYVVNGEDTTEIYGNSGAITAQNPVSVPFTQPLLVSVDENEHLAVFGTVAQDATADYFQLNLANSGYVDARDTDSGLGVPVSVETGDAVENLRSEPKRIFFPDQERPFQNFPNPFGQPDKEITTFIYYLDEDTDVDFRVYTLTGKLVWSDSYTRNDPQGRMGLHSNGSDSVTWDGKNENGHTVLNGVYILVMSTGNGHNQKTKIAYIK